MHTLTEFDPPAPDPLADLPSWLAEREVIPLDDSLALVIRHEVMHDIVTRCRQVAESPQPLLLTGETGVGKSLLGRFIHACRDPYAPFVSRMTTGLDEAVLDAWLFGAPPKDDGSVVAQAQDGTLVLEEMADLPPAVQRRLLGLWDGQAPGPSQWILTTNRTQREIRAASPLLPEFLARLAHVHVPPLRERRRDIPALAAFFAVQAAKRELPRAQLEALARRLSHYRFPGNVRELESLVLVTACQEFRSEQPVAWGI